MKKALVTLAIGKRYEILFNQHCKSLWSQYAEKNGFDLIVHTQPLDKSEKAQSRSPAWQKCLILSESSAQQYERIVWIDSDILINPNSPDITKEVPLEKIGAVDEYTIPTKEDYQSYLMRMYEYCAENDISYIENLTPTDYHRRYGFEGEFEGAIQTGVMVLSPRYHKELFEYVYYTYDDKGAKMNYEMRPLSYEILTRKLEFWLSPKFNMLWPNMKTFVYPCLSQRNTLLRKALAKLNINPKSRLIKQCVTAAFLNNYFIHFAGGTTNDMKYVDTNVNSIYLL